MAAAPGVSPSGLRDRIQEALPKGYEAKTGQQAAQDSSAQIKDALKFLNIALLVFAFIALFVGAFIIFNTFSILIAQRTRELALLRALGASARQVQRSVLAEAAIVGVVASVAGPAFGFVIAVGLQGLLRAFGIDPTAAAHRHCRPGGGHRHHRGLLDHAGHPRLPGAAHRGHARHGPGRMVANPTPDPHRPGRHGPRNRRADGRLVRRARRRHGRAGRGGDLPGRGRALAPGGSAVRQGGRSSAAPAVRRGGEAGSGERHAQPEANRLHGRGPDDRPGPGELRQHLRRFDQDVLE